MIYESRRGVAFVALGTRRRGQIGRSGGSAPARLNAVFCRSSLDFSGKKLDVTSATVKSRRQELVPDRERTMNDHTVAIVNGILIFTIVFQLILVKIWVS